MKTDIMKYPVFYRNHLLDMYKGFCPFQLFGDLDADGDGKIVEHEVMMANLTRILKQLPTLQALVQGENPYDTSDQEESLAESLDPEDIMEDYTENVFDDVLSEDLEHFVNSPKQTDTSRDEL